MGAASSGGSDNDVSGAEAVATGGTTYSSRQIKTVNKSISDQNKKNRNSSGFKPPAAAILDSITNSKLVQDNNYRRRVAFAEKSGKFTDTPLTRNFVLSSGFKTQLDGLGYTPKEKSFASEDDSTNSNAPRPTIIKKTAGGQTVQTTAPTEAELSQSAAADAEEYDLRKTKKRGRSITTLTSSKGLTDDKLTLGKPSLLGS